MGKVRGPKKIKRVRKKKRTKVKAENQAQEVAAHAALAADAVAEVTNSGQLRKKQAADTADAIALQRLTAGSDAEAESGAATIDGVRRKGGGGDGFDESKDGREGRREFVLGNAREDATKFASLRESGTLDTFDAQLTPRDAEKLGQFKCAGHLVRMYDHWMLAGKDRVETINAAAEFLAEFSSPRNLARVLGELEGKPIRDVYPLEVKLYLLENHPEKLTDISLGNVLGKRLAETKDSRLDAGHATLIAVPSSMRIKHFAILDGKRPGYEFAPSPKADHYSLLVDTPGEYSFAVQAVFVEKIGKLVRERAGGIIDRFSVSVHPMGPKPATED